MNSLAAALGRAREATLSMRLRRMRVAIIYWWRHGVWPNLDRPRRFTEWVQWRKLSDRNVALARLTDKAWSKEVVTARGLGHLTVPTLWQGTELPSAPPASFPLMVKASHSCNAFVAVRNADDWHEARAASRRWMVQTYGGLLDEWHYGAARPMILIEPFIGDPEGLSLPEDYKVYVFGGNAAIVQHHVGRGRNHRWTQYDRDWNRVGGERAVRPPPSSLKSMIAAAEALGAGHDFIRVDFYDADGDLRFGEFCLFPGSGLDPFDPVELDEELGRRWSAARA